MAIRLADAGKSGDDRATAAVDALRACLDGRKLRAPVDFGFTHDGRRWTAALLADDATPTVLRLTATLGFLPFAADSPGARRQAIALLADPPAGIAGAIALERSGRVVVNVRAALPEASVSGPRLITFLTVMMLQLDRDLAGLTAVLR